MAKVPEHILSQLAGLEAQNAMRSLKPQFYGVDFTSNDYLGLGKTPWKRESGQEGSGGSRLLAGNWPAHTAVEAYAAQFFGGEAALLFGSGYMANLGVLSCLPHRSDTVFFDEKCHASIKDGLRLGLAKHQSYRHNDLEDLKLKLSRTDGQKWVVTEGLFSMDGTIPDLYALVSVCESFGAQVIVDEAHSVGILGPNGRGACAMFGVQDSVLVRIYTFGKAIGRAGSTVVAPFPVIQFLINRSRPFIYTTSMPPISAISLFYALQANELADAERKDLKENIAFAASLPILGKSVQLESPIIPILVPGNENVRRVAEGLQEAGLDVRPILSPTVPAGSERLRIVLHAYNSSDEIMRLERGLQNLIS